MAVNQHVITRGRAAVLPVDLDFNYQCEIRDSPQSVINAVREHTLVSLVFNCHGEPGSVEIGSGIGSHNVHLFTQFRLKTKEIWFSACNVAANKKGMKFCQDAADHADAYVIASTELQKQSSGIEKGHIRDMNMPVYLFYPNSGKDPEIHKWTQPTPPPG